jgi:hypothetical protein
MIRNLKDSADAYHKYLAANDIGSRLRALSDE